jgi:hypothetical protein
MIGPPDWQPHRIMTRRDGWIVGNRDQPHRIPAAVAEMIVRALPPFKKGTPLANIRARMLARQRIVMRQSMHDAQERMFRSYDE